MRARHSPELVVANRVIAHLKLVDSFGHITIRNPENPQRFFMSRSRAPSLVAKEDILEFNLDSSPVDLRGFSPYKERFIHGALYRARPDVVSVCHNHAHELLPLAVTKTAMRPALHSASVIGHDVPVWDIRDEFGDTDLLVTSNEMGDSLARGREGPRGADARPRQRHRGEIGTGRSVYNILLASERRGPHQGHVHGQGDHVSFSRGSGQVRRTSQAAAEPGTRLGGVVFPGGGCETIALMRHCPATEYPAPRLRK